VSPGIVVKLLALELKKNRATAARQFWSKFDLAILLSSSKWTPPDMTSLLCALIEMDDYESVEAVLKSTPLNEGSVTLGEADFTAIIDACVSYKRIKCAHSMFKASKVLGYRPNHSDFRKVVKEAVDEAMWMDARKVMVRMLNAATFKMDPELPTEVLLVCRGVVEMTATADFRDKEKQILSARKLFELCIKMNVFNVVGLDKTRIDLSAHDLSTVEMVWSLKFSMNALCEEQRVGQLDVDGLFIKVPRDKRKEVEEAVREDLKGLKLGPPTEDSDPLELVVSKDDLVKWVKKVCQKKPKDKSGGSGSSGQAIRNAPPLPPPPTDLATSDPAASAADAAELNNHKGLKRKHVKDKLIELMVNALKPYLKQKVIPNKTAFKKKAQKLTKEFLKLHNQGDDVNTGEIDELREEVQAFVDNDKELKSA